MFHLTAPDVAAKISLSPRALSAWKDASAAIGEDTADVSIFDVIGDYGDGGITPARISGILRSIGDRPIVVSINSPGGSFFDAVAIHNILRRHSRDVTVHVVGVAASAASIIAMAGRRVLMGNAAQMMIHNTWTIVTGNADDMRAVIPVLDGFDETLAALYSSKTGIPTTDLREMMRQETWMDSAKAISNRFADGYIERDDVLAAATPARIHGLRELVAEFGGRNGRH